MTHHNIASHAGRESIGVLLVNIGTPAAPTPRALYAFLREFLSDSRVIDYPRWLWLPLLYGVILNVRPPRSARLYQRIWTEEGSPLLVITRRIASELEAKLSSPTSRTVKVVMGMRYGGPSIGDGLRSLLESGVEKLLVLPLFPQYSSTTTGTAYDAVFEELKTWRWMPELRAITSYHDHPAYLESLANSIREGWETNGKTEKTLLSFHGLPQRYVEEGDPYYEQCQDTARGVAARLDLRDDDWQFSFQSRFGPAEWLKPYTNEVLAEWAKAGVESVSALCPGFAADCLETLEEIGHRSKQSFEAEGGGRFHYIPALNNREDHLHALAEIARSHIQDWLTNSNERSD